MLTLEEVKLHLRVDHAEEDSLLAGLIATATAACADYLNILPSELATNVPAPVKSAALLLVGTLYEHRESVSERPYNKNPAFEALLNPYRVHS